MMSDYDVSLVDDNTADMYVIFHGPKDSAQCCHHLGKMHAHGARHTRQTRADGLLLFA